MRPDAGRCVPELGRFGEGRAPDPQTIDSRAAGNPAAEKAWATPSAQQPGLPADDLCEIRRSGRSTPRSWPALRRWGQGNLQTRDGEEQPGDAAATHQPPRKPKTQWRDGSSSCGRSGQEHRRLARPSATWACACRQHRPDEAELPLDRESLEIRKARERAARAWRGRPPTSRRSCRTKGL